MDDPWLNAWHDPLKLSPRNPSPSFSSSKFITDDQADIGLPSWDAADAAPAWTGATDPQDELWTRDSRASQLWTTPTLESIGFAKPSDEPATTRDSPRPPSPQHLDPEQQDPPEPIVTPATPPEEAEPSPVRQSLPESLGGFGEEVAVVEEVVQRGASPDPEGFGTFSLPLEDSWTPSHSTFPQTEETSDWGATWKDQSESADNDVGEPVDEWELAKRQKEKQDRYVPPAVLHSILRSYNEFAEDYWPEQQPEEASDVYQHNREDLAEILGITSIIDRLIPSDPSLSIPTAFIKTSTSKQMIETLKLTRHHIITRNSPLAVYLNTKGSLSWEAAIKSTPDITETDVIPVGWRILPKENADQLQSTNDTKKRASGGLLSFFGRRSAAGSPPIRPNTPAAGSPRSSTASPRPSADLVNALTPRPATPKEFDATSSASMSAVPQVSGTSQIIDNHATPDIPEHTQASSVVARFLGRFSRSNRSTTSDSRNSIALSSDDLEFLSDIVPSASEDLDESGNLDPLSRMLHPPPVPAKLPPPLAPPPRAPPLPKPVSPPVVSSGSISKQGLSSSPSALTRGSRSNSNFDVLSPQSLLGPTSSQSQFASLYTPSRPPSSVPVIPTLPPPLSPTNSRSNTPSVKIKPPEPPMESLFNDEFSDFQSSPAGPSVPQLSIDPFFSSFTTSSSSGTLQDNQADSFDDFNDFISSPVAEAPKPIRVPQPSLMLPTPSPPVPPPKRSRSASLHKRRVSRQADSDQRALNLLEVAAARGKWPAPPSPLPAAIAPPPPQTNKSTTSSLLDMFDEQSTSVPAVQLASITESNSSPPPNITMMKGSTADGSLKPSSMEISDTKPAVPLIPMRQPIQPAHAARGHNQSLAAKQQWRASSPAAPRIGSSSSSSTRSSSPSFFAFENSNNNKSGSSSSIQLPQQPQQKQQKQQKPITGGFSSLANLTASAPGGAHNSRNTALSGGGGGKLSAQDLSFFEGL